MRKQSLDAASKIWTSHPETSFRKDMLPRLKSLLRRLDSPAGDAHARQIAAQGQRFAREQLSEKGLACYWYVVLRHYLRLLSPSGRPPPRVDVGARYNKYLWG